MSVSSLPEWKQLLLERKRREEEVRERKEREDEDRLSSMPAWKRGIIQRRRAKQEGRGEKDREREREGGGKALTDPLVGDAESSTQVQAASELAPTLEAERHSGGGERRRRSRVSMKTIGPIWQNPFIRSQSGWRRGRETERGGEGGVPDKGSEEERGTGRERENDIEKGSNKGHDREFGRGRDTEVKTDRSVGREPEREREKERGRESPKGRREGKRDAEAAAPRCPLIPGLRTIKADNIIIIEKAAKAREREKEGQEETENGKGGMRMDLRNVLAGGGSVTEIRASEVLITKTSSAAENSSGGARGSGREGEGERGSSEEDTKREQGTEPTSGREKERERERCGVKEAVVWPRVQITVQKEEREPNKEDSGLTERGGRVSQLLSKFGEQHPKPPCRSKSSDCFIRPCQDRQRRSTEELCTREGDGSEEGSNGTLQGVPKRSFSFSGQVACARENGPWAAEERERRAVEGTYSDRRAQGHNDKHRQTEGEEEEERADGQTERESAVGGDARTEAEERLEAVMVERADSVREAPGGETGGEQGFTLASVRNVEGVAFARRVPIKQDGGERAAERERKAEFEMEETKESEMWRRDGGGDTLCAPSPDRPGPVYIPDYPPRTASSFTECPNLHCAPAHRIGDPTGGAQWHTLGSLGHHAAQTVLSQHTEDLICKIGRQRETNGERDYWRKTQTRTLADTDMTSDTESDRSTGVRQRDDEVRRESDAHVHRATRSNKACEDGSFGPRSPKRSVSDQGVHVPRNVFYGVDVSPERKRPSVTSEEGPSNGEGGGGLERRESWKAGQPLARIESLRERIQEREREGQRSVERVGDDGDGESRKRRSEGEGLESDREGEKRREVESEWGGGVKTVREAEGTARAVAERRQDGAAPQTPSPLDVTQEVGVSKASPRLPVPLSHSQSFAEEEEARGISVVTYSAPGTAEREEEPTQHVEESGCHRGWRLQDTHEGGDREEDQLEEEYLPPLHSPSPTSSLSPSPSPPLPDSLAAMSRIYNLKMVGSRTAVCISERTAEVVSHSHSTQHEQHPPLRHTAAQQQQQQSGPEEAQGEEVSPWSAGTKGDEVSPGLHTVQRQVEQLRLREQDAQEDGRDAQTRASKSPLRDKETQAAHGQRRPEGHKQTPQQQEQHLLHPSRGHPKDQPTSPRVPQAQPRTHRTRPKQQQQQSKSFTANARSGQLSENSRKTPDQGCPPAPPSSPCSLSPSPSLAPSPSPSPPLFSIRSASSAGPGRRGTTITITPRRPAGGVMAAAAAAGTSAGPSASRTAAQAQAPAPNGTGEGGKKRYPTVEEIEVIGGYQNLEKSCLVKNRGTHKGMKVCFDETQLERVYEYPSENSVLACLPVSPRLGPERGREERVRVKEVVEEEDEEEEEEEEERGVFVSRSSRSVGAGAGRLLRVDESCRR